MTYRDLPLPAGLSRKKKLSLYKAFFIQGTPNHYHGTLEINQDNDRYALSTEDAINLVVNEHGIDKFNGTNIIDVIKETMFAVVELTLGMEAINGPVLIDPNGNEQDPNYIPEHRVLNATVRDRISHMDIVNYTVDDCTVDVSPASSIITLSDLKITPRLLKL